MKKKIPALLWLLIIPAVLIAALGAWMKYGVLLPQERYQDEPVMAVPFLLLANEEDREMLRHERPVPEETQVSETRPAETEPPLPTEAETQPPTEPETEPPTQPPVEEKKPVQISESWFDDALFIGDSRTEGLSIFARLGRAQYFCKAGMTVYNVQSARCSDTDFGKTYLSDLLTRNSYGKIYIGLGLNEIGYNRAGMLEKYQSLIDLVREKQPEAEIVLQSIMTLGRGKSASREYFSLENIQDLNKDIAALADGDRIHYIDVNEWIADEDGYLPDELSEDGCHLYGSEYDGWAQWLMDSAATLEIES